MKELINKLEFDVILAKIDVKKLQDKIYEIECLIRLLKNENNSRSNIRDDRKQ
jgi:hypothetical protein